MVYSQRRRLWHYDYWRVTRKIGIYNDDDDLDSISRYHHIYRDEEGRNIVMLLKAEVDQLIGDLHHQMEEVKDVEDKLATVKGEDDDKHLLIMKSKVMEDDDKLIQEINTHT